MIHFAWPQGKYLFFLFPVPPVRGPLGHQRKKTRIGDLCLLLGILPPGPVAAT